MNLFQMFLGYRLGGAWTFGRQSRIEERRKPKKVKEYPGRVVWNNGTLRLRVHQTGIIRGKAAIKAAKKLTHQRGYYGNQRKEAISISR